MIQMEKTGNRLWSSVRSGRRSAIWALLAAGVLTCSAYAAEVQFTAQADQSTIAADDSVSVKLTIQIDGSARVGAPEWSAPDFILLNEFQSQFTQGYYNNGSFGMRTTYSYTKVLRPKQVGKFKISGLRVVADGQTKSAPDISVEVTAGGGATQPPSRYGGTGVGLRGAGKPAVGAQPMFIRAEVDKDRAYKGEQIIVSYYAYWRTRVFNIQVEKFPTLTGFLREELDMPIVSGRLVTERVVLDGVPYERALIVRYAAYPLQEGKLTLDPLGLKYNYNTTRAQSRDDDEDPLFGFFQQMTPRAGGTRSEPTSITALSVPTEGRPASFSGGVGEFSVIAVADKLQLKAGEAVTLTVKVEGRGNVASIVEPKPAWPQGIEVYDSKGVSKASRAGVGEKIFEIVLIPRQAGKFVLPAIELSFFSPTKRVYVTKKTEPIELVVEPGMGGDAPLASSSKAGGVPGATTSGLSGLKSEGAVVSADLAMLGGIPIWRWLYWLGLVTFILLVLTVGTDQWRKWRRRQVSAGARRKKERSTELRRLREAKSMDTSQVTRAYERLVDMLVVVIEEHTGLSLRSLPRSEIRDRLREHATGVAGITPELWAQIDGFLEFADLVRFAGGAPGTEEAARAKLSESINQVEALEAALEKISKQG